jgi:hypothetical protein
MLEKEGSNPDGENQIAVEKLAVINCTSVEQGLWDGRVKVFQAVGMSSVKNTRFEAHLESQTPLSTISRRWKLSGLCVSECSLLAKGAALSDHPELYCPSAFSLLVEIVPVLRNGANSC